VDIEDEHALVTMQLQAFAFPIYPYFYMHTELGTWSCIFVCDGMTFNRKGDRERAGHSSTNISVDELESRT
jgi:hypothetical protein